MYRLLVSGSRNFEDYNYMSWHLDHIHMKHEYLTIVHGDCPKGADFLARCWAQYRGVPEERYPADWNKYGKAAGFIRNQKMVDTYPDEAWFFPKGVSRGTWDCFDKAVKAGIPYVVFGVFE